MPVNVALSPLLEGPNIDSQTKKKHEKNPRPMPIPRNSLSIRCDRNDFPIGHRQETETSPINSGTKGNNKSGALTWIRLKTTSHRCRNRHARSGSYMLAFWDQGSCWRSCRSPVHGVETCQ